tara:strand:- start:557 stop:871 length:315 start_codon:yes stop_codon:yes gene_type:complete
MKITKSCLNQIINEELTGVFEEVYQEGPESSYKRDDESEIVEGPTLGAASFSKRDDDWTDDVDKDIERRGTKGKCTPISKKGCTGRAKTLAKTFKKMARDRKDK